MADLISIIVPVYNEESTIATVIDLLRTVPLPAAREIIVVNDGSRDGTRAALEAIDGRFPEVSILNVPENRSMPGTGTSQGGIPMAVPANPPAQLRPSQIASAGSLNGTVVRRDFQPLPGAKLRFVNSQAPSGQQMVTANASGQFHVALAPGAWKLYMDDSRGQPVLHSQVDVNNGVKQVTVVSR